MGKVKKPTFIIDTNVLIDYPDIIQNGKKSSDETTIDLSNAHLVIPTVVIRELSNFKREKSDRGKASREILRTIRNLIENDISSMEDAYNLKTPVKIGNQLISICQSTNDSMIVFPFIHQQMTWMVIL